MELDAGKVGEVGWVGRKEAEECALEKGEGGGGEVWILAARWMRGRVE